MEVPKLVELLSCLQRGGLAQGWVVPISSPPRSPSTVGHHLHLRQCRSLPRWGVIDTNLIKAGLHLHLQREAHPKWGMIYTIINMELAPGGVSSTPPPRRKPVYNVADTEPTPWWCTIYIAADTSHCPGPFAPTLNLTRSLVTPTPSFTGPCCMVSTCQSCVAACCGGDISLPHLPEHPH